MSQNNSLNAAQEEADWENEGRFMEIEKKLWQKPDGGVRRKPGAYQRYSSQSRKSEQGTRDDNTERGTDYESNQGTRLQQQNRGDVTPNEVEKAEGYIGDQSGATDWQDFEDYRPGYSGHQGKQRSGGGVLPGEDLQRKRGEHSVSRRTRPKSGTPRKKKMTGRTSAKKRRKNPTRPRG